MADDLRPIETPFDQRVADFKRRQLPLIVWSVAALACAFMLAGRAGRYEYIGLARATQYEISASATGQLTALAVDLYDSVESGDVLVRINDAEIAARLERSRATIRQLTAEMAAARSQLMFSSRLDQAGWTADLRRFQTDEEERRLAALELSVTVETDEIEAERLALELARGKPLFDSGIIGESEYDAIRLEHDVVSRRLTANRVLLTQTREEYRAARERRQSFERDLPSLPGEAPLLDPLQASIEIENQRLREIQARRRATVLRSPVAGQVSTILARQGQTVTPGQPILTVTERAVTEVLAFLQESDGRIVHENTLVQVSSINRPGQVAESVVTRVGPDLEVLPERLWPDPSTPEYGRAVVIASVPGLQLTPGELLNVRFLDER